eukprot:sb/3476166/
MSHYCQGQRYSRTHSDDLLLHQTRQWHVFRKYVAHNVAVHDFLSSRLHRARKFSIMLEHNAINLVWLSTNPEMNITQIEVSVVPCGLATRHHTHLNHTTAGLNHHSQITQIAAERGKRT